jgi:hypothetical protein
MTPGGAGLRKYTRETSNYEGTRSSASLPPMVGTRCRGSVTLKQEGDAWAAICYAREFARAMLREGCRTPDRPPSRHRQLTAMAA